jgi:hypothetical protein
LAGHNIAHGIGTSGLDRLASSSGLARATVSSVAAFLLPRLIGRLTPNGVLPSTTALLSQVRCSACRSQSADAGRALLMPRPIVVESGDQSPIQEGWKVRSELDRAIADGRKVG